MKRKNSELDLLLAEPVDIHNLIDKLDFSEENIIVATREQAALFLEASRYRVKKMRARIQAESALESERTKAAMFLRAKKKESGFTEGYIRDRSAVRPSVEEAKKKYERCLVYEEWSKHLLEAYRQRSHAIKTLAEILGAEANAQARLARKDMELAGIEALKSAVRKKYPGRRD